MAGRLHNLKLFGNLVQTYESGGNLPLPGVMVGNERANVGVAPDNDPVDKGLDVFANVDNGTGPQFDGPGHGVMIDLDTNESNEGLMVGGVDDSDGHYGGDLAINGEGGSTPDDGFLAVHLSGTNDDTVNGVSETSTNVPEVDGAASSVTDGGVAGTGLVNFDDV
jgi:hypothetical protein